MKTHTITYSIGHDRNGNKVCRVKIGDSRAFSIQTNGNLPQTHRIGVTQAPDEVAAYVASYGTAFQRAAIAKAKGAK